jgi:hypothetical protein
LTGNVIYTIRSSAMSNFTYHSLGAIYPNFCKFSNLKRR